MSWIISCATSGETLGEVFSKESADKLRQNDNVNVEPTREYLERIARQIKEADQ